MRRREFIRFLLAGAAVAQTFDDVFAEQKSPTARIGYLSIVPPPSTECLRGEADVDPACWLSYDLYALGWREGENLRIERRSSNGDLASLPQMAAELVALRPDVLVAPGSNETKALQAATNDIPIFFQTSSDPVGYGLVDSIARPGRNVTGIAVAPQMLWSKRLELLVELLGRRPAKIAWLSNPDELPANLNEEAVTQSAHTLGIEVERWEVRKPQDFERVFSTASANEAVLVQFLHSTTVPYARQIAELAVRYRLPTICEANDFVVAGALMSYGIDYREIMRYGARYIDRLLRGARPKDLPVEQISKFELVINLKTAKAMGVMVPEALLARADKVIE